MDLSSDKMVFDVSPFEDGVITASRNHWGKTTLVKNYIEPFKHRAVILDTQNDFGDDYTKVHYADFSKQSLAHFVQRIKDLSQIHVVFDDVDVYDPQNCREFYNLMASAAHKEFGWSLTVRRFLWLDKITIQNAKYLIFSNMIPIEDKVYLQKAGINLGDDFDNKLKLVNEPHKFIYFNTYDGSTGLLKTRRMHG